ncbi:MAG: response regulator [Armatimonadota bacterium]
MKKILIVDDEKDIVNMIAIRLKRWGYIPLKAFDGKEALNLIKKEPPDLIILDLKMPKVDGYEFCKKLREQKKNKDIPILIYTASTAVDHNSIVNKTDVLEVITKPFDPDYLKDRLEKILNQ